MNLEQLRYVKEIVETHSMSIAAQNLFITQSAISQAISALEQELDVTLFKRSRFGTHPTDNGKKIIQKILELLEKEQELLEQSRIISDDFTGELKIAASPSIFMTFLLNALVRFKKDFPQIHVSIEEVERIDIQQCIKKQTHDLGFTLLFDPGEKLPSTFISQPLHYEGTFTVLVSKESSLAFHEQLNLSDLIKHPFILYDRHYFRELMNTIENEVGEMNIILRTKNTEIVKRAVAEKVGITIMSSLMVENDPFIETGKIVAIPLQDNVVDFTLKLTAFYHQHPEKQQLIRTFIRYLL